MPYSMDSPSNPFKNPDCTFADAVYWVAYRDAAKVDEAPPLFSLRDWPSEVREAFWALLRSLEEDTVRSTLCGVDPIDPRRWRNDRLALRSEESISGTLGHPRYFIVEVERATHNVFVSTADLVKVFPAESAEEQPRPTPLPKTQAERVAAVLREAYPAGRPSRKEIEQSLRQRPGDDVFGFQQRPDLGTFGLTTLKSAIKLAWD